MKKIARDNLIKRTSKILRSNDGASLVLVSILAIIVLTAVVILRVTTNTFMASSNKQLNQDQAYELAASLGESIDTLVEDGKYNIYDVQVDGSNPTKIYNQTSGFSGLPNASVVAEVTKTKDGKGKVLKVTAHVGAAEYVYIKEYRK